MKKSTLAQLQYNNKTVLIFVVLSVFLGCANALRIAVITDVHLNMTD